MTPTASDPKAVVARYLDEVLNGRNLEAVDEIIGDPDVKARVLRFRSAFPDLQVETHRLIAEGDLVAVYVTGRGTHKGLFAGKHPPTGRTWQTDCNAMYLVRDGKIVDFWVNWDWLDLSQQLGLVPAD